MEKGRFFRALYVVGGMESVMIRIERGDAFFFLDQTAVCDAIRCDGYSELEKAFVR